MQEDYYDIITYEREGVFMDKKQLTDKLNSRFNENMHRHPNKLWEDVVSLLNDDLVTILLKMEDTGGEPDFVELNDKLYAVDMVKESPKGRRSLCYDKKARLGRKKFPPESSVEEMAKDIGIEIVSEQLYLALQTIEMLDTKTSSWLKTPDEIRTLNGAIFGDNRFERAFIFHNTAESYYKDRGFRGYIKLNA